MRLYKEKNNLKRHGLSHTKSYLTWSFMMRRCYKKTDSAFKDYGGRGIKVCERWHNFIYFYEDMGERKKGKTLERINNNAGYSPNNCKWVSRGEQSRNRRSNIKYTINGKTMIQKEWAKKYKINYWTLRRRLEDGWSIIDALKHPLKKSRYDKHIYFK